MSTARQEELTARLEATFERARELADIVTQMCGAPATNAGLRDALDAIAILADSAQGDWAGVQIPYAPEWTHGYKNIAEFARAAALAAATGETP